MLLTDKLKKIEVALKLLCKQIDDSNKPNMSPSEKEELMLNIQDQKKLKNRMEIILAKIHHDSSDVSNKDKDNYYPNQEDKINLHSTFVYNRIDVDKLFFQNIKKY